MVLRARCTAVCALGEAVRRASRLPSDRRVLDLACRRRRVTVTSQSSYVRASSTMRPQQTQTRARHIEGNKRRLPDDIPSLPEFLAAGRGAQYGNQYAPALSVESVPSAHDAAAQAAASGRLFHVETYGCQMNVADTEIVRSVLLGAGYTEADVPEQADVLLVNTCAIRDGAEAKVRSRLKQLRAIGRLQPNDQTIGRRPAVGVLGCMAERVKGELFESELVDLVAGPDAYRDLPRLLEGVASAGGALSGANMMNVQLSLDETYADIAPVRRGGSLRQAFVSIMRGCNNMCTYCIVPRTRGRERSRPHSTIVDEVRRIAAEEGAGRAGGGTARSVREITLLGQNVNSYHDRSEGGAARAWEGSDAYAAATPQFSNTFKRRDGTGVRFAQLLSEVAEAAGADCRVRFTSPHPKDFPPQVLEVMARHSNICKQVHLPAQSGADAVLQRMGRGYTADAYLTLVGRIRESLGEDVAISSDFISGFCGETEKDHEATLRLIEAVGYDQCFMFAYSERPQTRAHRRFDDDIPKEVKQRRLREVIETFRCTVQKRNDALEVGRVRRVLVDGAARRGAGMAKGRTDGNKAVFFALDEQWSEEHGVAEQLELQESGAGLAGEYLDVRITEARGHTLRGVRVAPPKPAHVSMPTFGW